MTALPTKDDSNFEEIIVCGDYEGDEPGTLIVCGDYQGDLEAIARVLNAFEFGQGDMRDQRFVVHDGPIEPSFWNNGLSPASPIRWWYTSKDGRRLPANEFPEFPELPDEEEWERDCDVPEDLSVEQLSKIIAPLLTRGTLELVSVRAYKTWSVQFARLAIRADGRAQHESRNYTSAPVKNWHEPYRATYEPPHATRSTLRTINMGENTCGQS
jgi:hypothetical protein